MSDTHKAKVGHLAYALAGGQPAAEAALTLGLSLDEVSALLDDPLFLDLVAGWRAYRAAPDDEQERLKHLYAIASTVLRLAAAEGDPTVLATLAEMEEEDAERGTVH